MYIIEKKTLELSGNVQAKDCLDYHQTRKKIACKFILTLSKCWDFFQRKSKRKKHSAILNEELLMDF